MELKKSEYHVDGILVGLDICIMGVGEEIPKSSCDKGRTLMKL